MLEDGLLEEVKRLMERGYAKELVSMQGLDIKKSLIITMEKQALMRLYIF